MATKKHPCDKQQSDMHTHTQTYRGWCGWLKRQQQLLPDNPHVSKDRDGGRKGEKRGWVRQTSLFIGGKEGGRWCMIKRKQSCHHFWKVGENNSPPPLLFPFLFSTSITVWRTDKRMILESQRGKERGRDLAASRSTVGSVVQINSLP